MSTGGGAPCFHDGIKVINQTGLSIFLDVPVDQLVERVAEKTNRPLLKTTDKEELTDTITNMRATRLDCYKQAKISIENPTLTKLLGKIKR